MLETHIVPLHLKNFAKEIGYREMARVKQVRFWKVIAIAGWVLFFVSLGLARAEEINLDIIATIESSNNPLAYNPRSGARGLYQITEICLKDYNSWHSASKIASNALYSPKVARIVAEWYLGIRIPQMLKFYGIEPKIDNILIAYDFGIGNLVKYWQGRIELPEETRNYIKHYKQLAGGE